MTEFYNNILKLLMQPENIQILLKAAGWRDEWEFEGNEDVFKEFMEHRAKLTKPIIKLENVIVGINHKILGHDSLRIYVPNLYEKNGTTIFNNSLDLQAVNQQNSPNINITFPKGFTQSCKACRIVCVFSMLEIPNPIALIRTLNEFRTCFITHSLGIGRQLWASFIIIAPDTEHRALLEDQDFIVVTPDDLNLEKNNIV